VNLVVNGDGETGPCEASNNITHPTGWNFNGAVTQMLYDNAQYGTLFLTSLGPRYDRDKFRYYFSS